ncbi:hypothetical protein [Kribbella sp. NPDC050459]|uniref:hypothetical protein n=1 Tax=Kribbella sp. NPDC050459 TaxID=3155785 RepID=UPI0033FCF7E5
MTVGRSPGCAATCTHAPGTHGAAGSAAHPETNLLYYSPAKRRWYITAGTNTWTFRDIGSTANFGDIADGRPLWAGDFAGNGKADIMFYSPSDDNWWLGSISEVASENAECAQLRSQIFTSRRDIATLQATKSGLDPKSPVDLAETREVNQQITALNQHISATNARMATLSSAHAGPGGKQLVWTFVGKRVGWARDQRRAPILDR